LTTTHNLPRDHVKVVAKNCGIVW